MSSPEFEISSKSAKDAGFPELAGVQIENADDPIIGALSRKRLTPLQLTAYVIVNGIVSHKMLSDTITELCGDAWYSRTIRKFAEGEQHLAKLIAPPGTDDETASSQQMIACDDGQGNYELTRYGLKIKRLFEAPSSSESTTAKNHTSQEIQKEFDNPEVSLSALKSFASNPETPSYALACIFKIFPDIVAKNPSWLFAKWSMNVEIGQAWKDSDIRVIQRYTNQRTNIAERIDRLDDDDYDLYFKSWIASGDISRFVFDAMTQQQMTRYLEYIMQQFENLDSKKAIRYLGIPIESAKNKQDPTVLRAIQFYNDIQKKLGINHRY
jgi:hypothetical protein